MSATLKFGGGQWAVKKGSTLAYNDEGNNYKPLPFTFDRSTSATRVNKQGLIEVVSNNEPRIDFLNDSKGALLLEPSRSNLVTYSEDFSQSIWNTFRTYNVNVTSTTTINPKGEQGAYKIVSTNADNQFASIFTILSGQSYSNSIYVKRVSGVGDIILRNVNNDEVNFQLNINDGWKRINTTVTSNSVNGRMYLSLANSGDEIEVWGAQLEQGSYATSYIPTQGGIGTRDAEICNGAGNDQVINSTEGTLFADFSILSNNDGNKYINIGDGGTLTNNVIIGYVSAGLSIQIYKGGLQVSSYFSAESGLDYKKIGVTWKENEIKFYKNGILLDTDLTFSTFAPNTLNELYFDISGRVFYGKTKDVRVYNTSLTEIEMIKLTKI